MTALSYLRLRKATGWISVAVLLYFLSTSLIASCNAESVPMGWILSKGLINTKVNLLPANHEFVVQVEVRNNSRERLEFYLEPGRIFNALPDEFQDLIAVSRIEMVLEPSAVTKAVLSAYCKNKHKKGPACTTPMELGPMASEQLVRICRYISDRSFRTETIRHAVWAVSDTIPLPRAFLVLENEKTVAELERYLDVDLGRATADHVLDLDTLDLEEGLEFLSIEDQYDLKQKGTVRIVFTDYHGEVLRELMSPTVRPADRFDLEVNMIAKDLKSGLYFIRILSDGVLQKQWEIFI
jgi:hypothetical protein